MRRRDALKKKVVCEGTYGLLVGHLGEGNHFTGAWYDETGEFQRNVDLRGKVNKNGSVSFRVAVGSSGGGYIFNYRDARLPKQKVKQNNNCKTVQVKVGKKVHEVTIRRSYVGDTIRYTVTDVYGKRLGVVLDESKDSLGGGNTASVIVGMDKYTSWGTPNAAVGFESVILNSFRRAR